MNACSESCWPTRVALQLYLLAMIFKVERIARDSLQEKGLLSPRYVGMQDRRRLVGWTEHMQIEQVATFSGEKKKDDDHQFSMDCLDKSMLQKVHFRQVCSEEMSF